MCLSSLTEYLLVRFLVGIDAPLFTDHLEGRNWNAGETIELVLRKPNGEFWPMEYLLGVFCHELAHIKVSYNRKCWLENLNDFP